MTKEDAATDEASKINGFWSSSNQYGFLNIFGYHEEKVALDKYTTIEKERIRTFLQMAAMCCTGRP